MRDSALQIVQKPTREDLEEQIIEALSLIHI